LFTCELLDAWLWDICGTGGTFREIISSWDSQRLSHSASFHRFGREGIINRQRGNDTFSAYLKTLRFSRDDDLYSLFSCSKSERNPDKGPRELDAVVMDATALGILGTLPKFRRETRLVSAVPRIPNRQYIMRTPKLRAFIDSILTSAKGAQGLEYFNVPLRKKLWKDKPRLVKLLFGFDGGVGHEAFVPGKFMNACFSICDNAQTTIDGNESDAEEEMQVQKILVKG